MRRTARASALPTLPNRLRLLNTAAAFETLLAKNQHARETYFFLNAIYSRTGNSVKLMELEARAADRKYKFNWKVEADAIAPEDLGAFQAANGSPGAGGGTNVARPGEIPTVRAGETITGAPTAATGGVAPVPTKFALIVGNAQSRLTDGVVPFAEDDARRVRESLIANAGYPEANIDLILNTTSTQLMESARALAERVPEGGTVFIYFSGAGVNVDGRDYLAGVESELATDPTGMVPKSDIYRLFMAKGARIFAFFQANRLFENGRYFGAEVPLVGSISQTQATMPGERITSYVRNGKQVGIFTDAMVNVMSELRTNRLPIMEFGWQIFYRMKRAGTGSTGGGSRQTPTLPHMTNMASDARF